MLLKFAIYILISLTVFSEYPEWVFPLRAINRVAWGSFALFFLLTLKKKIPLQFLLSFCAIYSYFILFRVILSMNLGYDYSYFSSIFTMVSSLVAYLLGMTIAPYVSSLRLKQYCKYYVWCIIILTLCIDVKFLGSFSQFINSSIYLYSGKNLLGQLVFSALLIWICLERDAYFFKTITAFLLILGLMTQCRSGMISFMLAIFIISWGNKKIRYLFLCSAIIGILLVLFVPFAQDAFKQAIVWHQATDLNTFSSGRIGIFRYVWEQFLLHPWFGHPSIPVDNFYLGNISVFGILGGGPLILLWIYRFIKNMSMYFKPMEEFSALISTLIALSIFFSIMGFFEGGGPFSPSATKLMWLLCGYLDYVFYHQNLKKE